MSGGGSRSPKPYLAKERRAEEDAEDDHASRSAQSEEGEGGVPPRPGRKINLYRMCMQTTIWNLVCCGIWNTKTGKFSIDLEPKATEALEPK